MRSRLWLAILMLALVGCPGVRSAYGTRITRVTFSEGGPGIDPHQTMTTYTEGDGLERAVKLLDKDDFFLLDDRDALLPAAAPTSGAWCAIEAEISDGKIRRVTMSNEPEPRACAVLYDAYKTGLRRPYCQVCVGRAPAYYPPVPVAPPPTSPSTAPTDPPR